uniref:Probable arginine--tRNA ligase, cytoplasmic n=1 Tax=Strigamia maritima TaxID=126957 RepID=T1IQB8_STRMM
MDVELIVNEYTQKAEKAEADIKKLSKELEGVKTSVGTRQGLGSKSHEFEKALLENTKLKCRLDILKRACSLEESKNTSLNDIMSASIQNILRDLFVIAIKDSFDSIDDPIFVIHRSQNEKFGDYDCNAAMQLNPLLKSLKGISIPPREIANRIIASVPRNDVIERTEIAGPGFINIFLKNEFIQQRLHGILLRGVSSPYHGPKLSVAVDFSSPNIAKEMHVGHLRSTIIGDSICRVLEFVGHNVTRINHVGDWGTQFGMLIAHLQDEFPNYLTVSPPIQDLQSFYKQSKVRFDEDEEFKKRAYACVVKLQNHHPDFIKAWKLICDVSRKDFEAIYKLLDIKLIERGESFYQDMMVDVVKELEDKGFLEEDNGRKIMFSKEQDIPLTIVKSDGGFTYDTSDMAAIRHRVRDEKHDRCIYVVDAGQTQHFLSIFACAKFAGFFDPEKVRVEHAQFGVVLGEDKKKFKTRSGDTVRLVDLLNEGLNRSLLKLKEKNRDTVLTNDELVAAQKAVAFGCIKYADLSHNRTNDYIFSFDKMLDDKGNTAAYLLYAYTRICSIARTAQVSSEELRKAAEKGPPIFDHPKEWKLAKLLLHFSDVILQCLDDLLIHSICDYLYEISTTFTEFYDKCYCIEKDKQTGKRNNQSEYWSIAAV